MSAPTNRPDVPDSYRSACGESERDCRPAHRWDWLASLASYSTVIIIAEQELALFVAQLKQSIRRRARLACACAQKCGSETRGNQKNQENKIAETRVNRQRQCSRKC